MPNCRVSWVLKTQAISAALITWDAYFRYHSYLILLSTIYNFRFITAPVKTSRFLQPLKNPKTNSEILQPVRRPLPYVKGVTELIIRHWRQHPRPRRWWKIILKPIGYCSNTNCARRFRCEDNNVDFTHVQPHYYRMWQVESCHQLGWSSQVLFWSN